MINSTELVPMTETSLERDVNRAVASIGPVLDFLVEVGHTTRRASGTELTMVGVAFEPEYGSIHDTTHIVTVHSPKQQGDVVLTGERSKRENGLFLGVTHEWYVSDVARGPRSVNEDALILAGQLLLPVAQAWNDNLTPEEQVAFLNAQRLREKHAAQQRSIVRTIGRMIIPHQAQPSQFS